MYYYKKIQLVNNYCSGFSSNVPYYWKVETFSLPDNYRQKSKKFETKLRKGALKIFTPEISL